MPTSGFGKMLAFLHVVEFIIFTVRSTFSSIINHDEEKRGSYFQTYVFAVGLLG
jgi:uncharacterized membrane protein